MAKKTAEKSNGGIAARTSSSELSENNPRQNFRLGDITWVKHGGSTWWPAQVIDEASVSSKPKKKTCYDILVRLYGTCQYLYVDPWKSNIAFEMILKQENKTPMEAFHKVLQKELTHFKSPSDHDEEPVSTKAKTSVRKVRKQEGLKQEGQEGRKQKGASVSRSRPKKGSVVDGTHREIKTLVRDILLGDIVAKQHATELAHVDEVIFGLCDGTERNVTPGTTADTESGRSVKRAGGGLEADSSSAAKKPRKGRATNLENNPKGNDSNSSPQTRDGTMEGSEQRSARQIKIMQKLGLVAPSGSPFKGLVAAAYR